MNHSTEAQAYLAAIITSSDDAIISKDLNGNITSWNPAAERIFGHAPEEAIGRHITLIIPPERRSEEDMIIAKLRRGERIDHFETVRVAKDGRLIPISITVSPIRDGTGKVVGASKIARDIGERIEAEKALKELARKKDEFLANMSHELRTPMNAVIGIANLLQFSKTMSEKDRMFVDTLKLSADNLLALINDLLDFARIESGGVQLEETLFSLPELLQQSMAVIGVKAREKGLKLDLRYHPQTGESFIGDPLRIQQIVTNLLSNAVKFTDTGGVTIEVEALPSADGRGDVAIRVVDTGIGIAPDKLEMIFEKFSQADASYSRRFGGSGLGLAISRRLAEAMGGGLAVTSEQEVGATFILTLPLRRSEAETAADQAESAIQEPQRAHKNVLLVEDYEPNVLVASEMLSHLGYDYDVAGNGLEALRKFLHQSYDLILMDVQMQELDGLEATRRIRRVEEERNLPYTPVVAMTAHVSERDRQRCTEAGMDGFIPKPFEPSVLAETLQHYVEPAPTAQP